MLASGEAKLTHLAMIESVVTATNAGQLFDEVRGKSTREVERILRREDPKPDVSEAVTRVAAPRQESVELLAPDHWALRAMMMMQPRRSTTRCSTYSARASARRAMW